MALALTLSSLRNIVPSSYSVLNGQWDYTKYIGRQFNSLTIGIIGYGRLGRMYANFCSALGAKIIVFDPFKTSIEKKFFLTRNINHLYKSSDIISLHIHLDKKNHNMINVKKLNLMKPNVLLVNTSRGEIINEKNIITFLKKNPDAKFATDVIANEILGKNKSPLIKFAKKNNQIIITPHIGGMTVEAQKIAYIGVAKLLQKFFN